MIRINDHNPLQLLESALRERVLEEVDHLVAGASDVLHVTGELIARHPAPQWEGEGAAQVELAVAVGVDGGGGDAVALIPDVGDEFQRSSEQRGGLRRVYL